MSTSKKALTLSQMMSHYKKASKNIFNHTPYVTPNESKRLATFDKKLSKLDIYQKDYAYGVLNHVKKWVSSKKEWKTLPVHIFTGNWALKLYQEEIGNRTFNFITEDSEEMKILVLQEFEILRHYRFLELPTYKAACAEMMPYLSDNWKSVQNERLGKIVQDHALSLFEATYGERLELC